MYIHVTKNSYTQWFDTLIVNFQIIHNEVYIKDISRSILGAKRDISSDSLQLAFYYKYQMLITRIRANKNMLPKIRCENNIIQIILSPQTKRNQMYV